MKERVKYCTSNLLDDSRGVLEVLATFLALGGTTFTCSCKFCLQPVPKPPSSGRHKRGLKNSRYIYLWGPSLGKRGLIWSLLEIAKITQIIIYPRSSLHIGELDPDDLEKFPPRLRRLLKIKSIMLIVNGVWVVAVFVLLKFE